MPLGVGTARSAVVLKYGGTPLYFNKLKTGRDAGFEPAQGIGLNNPHPCGLLSLEFPPAAKTPTKALPTLPSMAGADSPVFAGAYSRPQKCALISSNIP